MSTRALAPGIDLPGADAGGAAVTARRVGAELALQAALTGAYVAAGKAGLLLAVVNASVTPVWPPTGIAIAALLVLGARAWPAVFLGAFLVNVTTAGGAWVSLGIAAGNTGEALAAAALAERFARGRRAFETPRGILAYVLLAGLAAPALGATVGAFALGMGGLASPGDAPAVWLTWWLGDAGGALIVAPALVLWAARPWRGLERSRALELAGAGAALLALGALLFGGLLPAGAAEQPLDFLCFPVLLWTAFRFGPRETALAAVALSGMSIWGTVHGRGPFVASTANGSLLLLQAFVATTSIGSLILAAVVADRREAAETLRRAHGELESRVQERTAELRRANEDLTLFASMAAHELQAPLRKIRMFADLLMAKEGPGAGPAEESVEHIQGSARRMSQLISDLLSLSRVTTDAKPLERVELEAAMMDVAADYANVLKDVGGRLDVGPLPAVRGDASQLRQLFGNLLSNAAKFRRKDAPLTVSVRCRRAGGGFVEVEVEDNGIGFDAAHSEKIFEPFQRLNRPTDYEGSGMGLAICRKIAVRHGGGIRAWGAPGRGATFVVALPSLR